MKDYFGKNSSVLNNKKLFLLDMDGTIYLGERLFDGVKEFLSTIEENGGRYVFITNNASKSVKDYVAKMHRLGLTNINDDNFYTSAQACFSIVKEKHGTDLIYIQATSSLINEYRNKGLNVTTEYTDDAKAIVVGYDPEITGEKMYVTCKMLKLHDLPYYATNPDWVCPVDFGHVPDCGSMCQGYERATGKKPIFIGKPEPTMIYTVMHKYGYSKEETVVIGDRLYTDIASGNNAGVDTICVLSGDVCLQEVLDAKNNEIPTFVYNSVSDIFNNK